MTDNPYFIPEDGTLRIINVSGGRSSGYMLGKILSAHDEALPDNVVPIFCNTGKERRQTLDFVARMEREWGCHIVWLEYRYDPEAKGGLKDPKVKYEIVNHNSASFNGEPFDQLLKEQNILPNQSMRTCTAELKVGTIRRYCLREFGLNRKQYISVLGYRYDEPRRWQKAQMDECRVEYPMVHDRVIKADVTRFWDSHIFDLEIPSWAGNCDLCFLKGKQTLLRTLREDPSCAKWWMDWENHMAEKGRVKKQEMAHWSQRHSIAELLEEAKNRPALPMEFEDDLSADCFCVD